MNIRKLLENLEAEYPQCYPICIRIFSDGSGRIDCVHGNLPPEISEDFDDFEGMVEHLNKVASILNKTPNKWEI